MFGKKCCRDDSGKKSAFCYCRCIGGVVLAVVLVFVFGYAVQALWNWLIPDIFKIGAISYAQALGLIVLARLIFGNVGGHHGGRHGHGWHKHGHGGSCGCSTGEDDIKDWSHYESWWSEEGKESFKKYAEKKDSAKG